MDHWKRTYPLIAAVCLMCLFAGCDLVEPDRFDPEIVVESYQIAGEPLQPVRLTWSVAIDERYDPEERAVSGANVQIDLLDENGQVEATYRYLERLGATGVYVSEEDAVVHPLRTYRLRAVVPDIQQEIAATTIVPDTFRVANATADTVIYQQTQAELTLTRSRYPNRQSVYVFSTTALEVDEDNLTPFYRSIFDASGDITLDDLEVASSGVLNEANFSRGDGDTIRITFPWIAIAFYGPNRVSVSAIDDNYYDFIRSQQAQQGGIGFSPGEIPNVITNVEGGAGLFASFSRSTFDLVVLPQR